MRHALGILPAKSDTITSSEMCGACHTVHLPGTQELGHVYEQTTYPEWAFSAYRTGDTPDGGLPFGAGPLAQSCQGCHMPNTTADGSRFRSKIAGSSPIRWATMWTGIPASSKAVACTPRRS